MSSKKQKIIVFFIGFFAIILLLELGLRVVGYIHLKKTTFDRRFLSSGQYTILCLGDSYTIGAGASRGNSYPEQLKQLINLRVKRRMIRVINGGVNAQNTTQLLNKLQCNINTIKPDLIILLSGGANYWNHYGYWTYLKGETLVSILHNLLYRIRVYKLIKLLFLNMQNRIKGKFLYEKSRTNAPKMDRYYRNGDLVHKNHQIGIPQMLEYNRGQEKYKETANRFKEGIRVELDKSEKYIEIAQTYQQQEKYEEAIKWFKEAARLNPTFNENYLEIGWLYRDLGKYEEAIKWFKEAIKKYPERMEPYRDLANFYISQDIYDEALEFFEESAKLKPELKVFVEIIEKKEGMNVSQWSVEVKKWVKSDIEKIARICKDNNIEMILQSYPNEPILVNTLENISKKYSIPFVDNCTYFELLKKGGERETYFIPDGHCNHKGYGIMAKNIYEKIVEEELFNPLAIHEKHKN